MPSADDVLKSIDEAHLAGDFEGAIALAKSLIAEDPDNFRLRGRLAELYALNGDIGNAVSMYRQLAEWYEEKLFYTKSLAAMRTAIELKPDDPALHEKAAHLCERLGLNREAVTFLEESKTVYEQAGDEIGARRVDNRLKPLKEWL